MGRLRFGVAAMTGTSFLSALMIGIVIGFLGQIALPGKQDISTAVTILVGVAAAWLGSWLCVVVGIPIDTPGIDWLELGVQVIVSAAGIAAAAALTGSMRAGTVRPSTPVVLPPCPVLPPPIDTRPQWAASGPTVAQWAAWQAQNGQQW